MASNKVDVYVHVCQCGLMVKCPGSDTTHPDAATIHAPAETLPFIGETIGQECGTLGSAPGTILSQIARATAPIVALQDLAAALERGGHGENAAWSSVVRAIATEAMCEFIRDALTGENK